MKPKEVLKLTPREFFNMIEGYSLREEKELEKSAVLAYFIGRTNREKKIPSPKQLLGKKDDEQKRGTLEERERALNW